MVVEWSGVLVFRWRSVGELSPFAITWSREVSGGRMSWTRLSHLRGSGLTQGRGTKTLSATRQNSQLLGFPNAEWSPLNLRAQPRRQLSGGGSWTLVFVMPPQLFCSRWRAGRTWWPSLLPGRMGTILLYFCKIIKILTLYVFIGKTKFWDFQDKI